MGAKIWMCDDGCGGVDFGIGGVIIGGLRVKRELPRGYKPEYDLRDLARQMRAAPDLLEALEDMTCIAEARGERLGYDNEGPVFDNARAAIARARGAA